MRTLLLTATVSLAPLALRGQDATDPRAVRPERPTVATHAWTIAPRYLEIFGFPATSGPAGAPGTVAVLAGPTLVPGPWPLSP